MKKELVEIYSDATNQAVLKHPDRNYPGVLIQGDDLYSFCQSLDEACKSIKENNYETAYVEINEIRNALWEKLIHYKVVLAEHHIDLPFSETP